MKFSRILLCLCICVLFVLIVAYPSTTLQATKNSISIFYYYVVPSMLPFFIASNIFLKTGVLKLLAKLFAPITRRLLGCSGHFAFIYLSSAFSGYPMGAKITASLYEQGELDQRSALISLIGTSITGPVFIIGSICTSMLADPSASFYFLLPHYLSALLVAIAFRFALSKKIPKAPVDNRRQTWRETFREFAKPTGPSVDVGEMLSSSIMNAISTVLQIGGFIVLFGVITALLEEVDVLYWISYLLSPIFGGLGIEEKATYGFLYGLMEITGGISRIATVDMLQAGKLCLISFLISFGGLSIHAQTLSIFGKTKINAKYFSVLKFLQGIVSASLTGLLLQIQRPVSVFHPTPLPSMPSIFSYISVGILVISLICLGIFFWRKRSRGM